MEKAKRPSEEASSQGKHTRHQARQQRDRKKRKRRLQEQIVSEVKHTEAYKATEYNKRSRVEHTSKLGNRSEAKKQKKRLC